MNDFVIFTDSSSDISPEILSEWGVIAPSLTFRFSGEDKEYSNGDMSPTEFYQRMRDGGVAKTSAVNTQTFKDAFENVYVVGDARQGGRIATAIREGYEAAYIFEA